MDETDPRTNSQPMAIPAPTQALDPEANRRLWQISEALTALAQPGTEDRAPAESAQGGSHH
jgi:hypothetical protein